MQNNEKVKMKNITRFLSLSKFVENITLNSKPLKHFTIIHLGFTHAPLSHTCPLATHAPWPCMPPCHAQPPAMHALCHEHTPATHAPCHTCPHACSLPHMPPCHACTLPHMPPATYAPPGMHAPHPWTDRHL